MTRNEQMAKVNIVGDYKETGLTEEKIKHMVESVFDFVGKDKSVNVAFVDADEIKCHNENYRKKDESTDILSFDYGKEGDVLVCLQIVSKYKESTEMLGQATIQTLIHGTLHLFGYDHETEKDYDIMKKAEDNILKKLR